MKNVRAQALFALILGTQMLSGGCDFAVMPGSPEGQLLVRVIDARENPVADAEVLTRGLFNDSLVSMGRTGSDGILKRSLLVGYTSVRVDPPGGFVVAPKQANPIRVQIESEKTTKVVFRLSRSPDPFLRK